MIFGASSTCAMNVAAVRAAICQANYGKYILVHTTMAQPVGLLERQNSEGIMNFRGQISMAAMNLRSRNFSSLCDTTWRSTQIIGSQPDGFDPVLKLIPPLRLTMSCGASASAPTIVTRFSMTVESRKRPIPSFRCSAHSRLRNTSFLVETHVKPTHANAARWWCICQARHCQNEIVPHCR